MVKVVRIKNLGAFFWSFGPALGATPQEKGWAATEAVIPASLGEPPICFFRRRNTQLRTSVAKRWK